ncbi:MAG: DUF1501 domain-containing protein [Phycisphaerales bacterium]|nr:DUF1501 domain-containing protein [Phycisphaerales bacterium]
MHGHSSCACREYNELSRRSFLSVGAGTLLASSVPAWLPRVAIASSERSERQVIVSIFLRGGADGLTLCVPHGDPLYYAASGPTARPTIAIAPPGLPNGCTNLDGMFGLPPAMASLSEAYQNGHLAVVHAAGLTDTSRSHFDAMKFMEVGALGNPSLFTGWLGRHLAQTDPILPGSLLRGISLGSYAVPTTMNGGPSTTPVPDVLSYGLAGNPKTAVQRQASLREMYESTPAILKNAAKVTNDTIALLDAIDFEHYQPGGGAVYPETLFGKSLKASAALIKAQVGVEAVCVDRGDWDTHSNAQPVTGGLAANMADLANGLTAFYRDIFSFSTNIVVVVMSEFGRRAGENASHGTDHGHGNAMFVMGGRVNGGHVYSRDLNGNPGWVGLGDLYEDLDVHITTDYRDILAEIVQKCLDDPQLDKVFPGWTPQFQGIIS